MPPQSSRNTIFKSLSTLVVIVVGVIIYWQQQRQTPKSAPSQPNTSSSASSPQPTSSSPTRVSTAPSASTTSPTTLPASGTIKIGSLNIEWLGKPEERGQFAKNVAQSPETIARYIAESGASVLGVAEVVATISGSSLRSREIESTIDLLNTKTRGQWEYALCPGRQDGDQLTGFLWNSRVVSAMNADGAAWRQNIDVPWHVPVREGRSATGSRWWARPPCAIKFSAGQGKTDFVMIVLHMKADYNGQFRSHRKEEMDALLEALPRVRSTFHDEDIVLSGDTNVTSENEPAITDAVQAGFVDLNARNISTTWRGGFTDRTFVIAAQPEFASHEFWVFSDPFLASMRWKPGDFKKNLSDHYMVGTTMRIMPDDD